MLAATPPEQYLLEPEALDNARFACLDQMHQVQMHDLRACGCQCVMVDAGLNDGATLMTWPKAAAEMLARDKQHTNQSRKMHACLDSQAATCFLGIEPNPRFTQRLAAQQAQLRARGVAARILTETALALEDGTVTLFAQDGPPDVDAQNVTHEAVGSSLEPGRMVTGWKNGLYFKSGRTAAEMYRHAQVRALGAAQLLTRLTDNADFVAVKLDIEGTELPLLRRLLVTEPRALCRLGALAVEWHASRLTNRGGSPDGVNGALSWILADPACGVPLLKWG